MLFSGALECGEEVNTLNVILYETRELKNRMINFYDDASLS